MGANFNPSMGSIKDMKPFKFWCQKVLPTVYDDSLSYYELLSKVVKYLNDNVDNINTLNDNVTNIYNAYLQLQDYVNNYFDSQDFQQMVNDKIDEMAENGTLTVLIKAYVDPLVEEKFDEVDYLIQSEFDLQNDRITDQDSTIAEFTGKVNTVESRMDNLINAKAGLSNETVLWTGDANYVGAELQLSDSVDNYDYIDVHFQNGSNTWVQRFPSDLAELTQGCAIALPSFPSGLSALRVLNVSNILFGVKSTNDLTLLSIKSAFKWSWDGEEENDSTAVDSTEQSPLPITIKKVVGVSNVQSDAEIVDARVGYDSSIYLTLGAAIRGQASEYMHALYEDKIFLQCGFANGYRNNQQGGEYIDESLQYIIYSINKIHFAENETFTVGEGFRVRRYWFDLDDTFVNFDGSWKTGEIQFLSTYKYYIDIARVDPDTTEIADISTFMQQVYQTVVPENLEKYVSGHATNVTNANIQALCGGDFDNLPSNTIYSISSEITASHKPTENIKQGMNLICLSKSETRQNVTGTVQIAVYSGGSIFFRSYWNSEWSVWHRLYEFEATRVLAFGDSICLGGRNDNRGFAGVLGVGYKNSPIDGGCLSTIRGNARWIETKIVAETGTDFDAVILEGGINDFIYDAPLGTMSSHPIRYEDAEYAGLNTGTIIGALEHAFGLMIHKFTNASKYFLITHKTRNYAFTPHFTGGYTQQELHDAIVACCRMYNIMVIDVYEKSNVNTYFAEYYSPTPWTQDHSVGDTYFVDNDRVHPLDFGYRHAYAPIIKEALKLNQ